MGAWGEGIFENDSAMDWLATAGGDPRAIDAAFDATIDAEYLDVDAGSAAIAAAAIVAAAVGGDRSELPEDAQQILVTVVADAKLCARASAAIERVLAPKSELRELWTESKKDRELCQRLEQLRIQLMLGQKSERTPRSQTAKPKRRKKIELTQGDIFEVPLEDGRRGYGQVLTWTKYGFFNTASTERLTVDKIITAPVAFRISCMSEEITEGHWPIIDKAPLAPGMREPLCLFRNNGPDWWFVNEWRPDTGSIERRVPKEEVIGLEATGLWEPRDAVKRLEMHLRGEPCPWVQIAR